MWRAQRMTTCTTKDSMATDTASVGANGWLAETNDPYVYIDAEQINALFWPRMCAFMLG